MKYNTKNYDYLIVGSGPFGATFACEAAKRGKKVLVCIHIKKMALMSMTMVLIFFILTIKKYGLMSIN